MRAANAPSPRLLTVRADVKATVYRTGSEHRTHNRPPRSMSDGLIQDHAQAQEALLVIDRRRDPGQLRHAATQRAHPRC